MLRLAFILVPILLIGACVMSVGKTVAAFDGSRPRVIDAPRSEVFDAIQGQKELASLEKVSDTGARVRYEFPLTEDVMKTMGEGADADGPFGGGKLSLILEPDRLLRIELVSRDQAVRLRFNAHFADDPTRTKTVITSDMEVTDSSLDEAERKRVERTFSVVSGMIVGKFISEAEKRNL